MDELVPGLKKKVGAVQGKPVTSFGKNLKNIVATREKRD